MHCVLLQATLVLSAAAVSSAEYLDKDVYIRHAAPKALTRIEDFRAQHQGNLTHSQSAVLDLSEKIVKNFATDEIGAVQSMCESAFTKEQCHDIFADDSNNQKRELRFGKRAPPCSCSTATDFCIGAGNACVPHDRNGGCAYAAAGCGALYSQYCNGLCRD